MQIHVTEEARHVCFADSYLESRVRRLWRPRLAQLRIVAPFATAIVADLMLRPPTYLFTRNGVPRSVVAQAYSSDVFRAQRAQVVTPLCQRYADLGIINRASRAALEGAAALAAGRCGSGAGKALSSGASLLSAE